MNEQINLTPLTAGAFPKRNQLGGNIVNSAVKTVNLVPSPDSELIMFERDAEDNIRMVNQHANEQKRRKAMEMQARRERRRMFLDRMLDAAVMVGVIFGLAVALSCLF